MKRIITLFCLIIFYQLVFAQWEEIHYPLADPYGLAYPQSICCVGEDILYLGFNNGLILRSCDCCETWDPVEIVPNPGVVDIVFYNHAVGWISSMQHPCIVPPPIDSTNNVSYGQCLQKTVDGGVSWVLLDTTYRLEHLFIASEDTLYGIENNIEGAIYRSVNGGYDWQKVFSINQTIYDMSILPDGIAYLLSDNQIVYKTSDYGQNWVCVQDDDNKDITMGNVTAIHFWNEGDGEIVGPRRYYTTDDFLSVGTQTFPWQSPSNMVEGVKLKYLDSGFGCVIGGSPEAGFKKMVLMTRDFGQTWSYCPLGTSGMHETFTNPLVDVEGAGDSLFYVLQSEPGGVLFRSSGGFPTNVSLVYGDVGVEVWPNPVTDILHVRTDYPIQNVSVFDVIGRRVLFQNYLDGHNQIKFSCETLPPGFYILHIQDIQQNKYSIKFDKTR